MGLSVSQGPRVSKRQSLGLNLDPGKNSLATVYRISSESHFTCLFIEFSQKPCASGSSLLKMKRPELGASRPPPTTVQQETLGAGPGQASLQPKPPHSPDHSGASGAPGGPRAPLLTFPAPLLCCTFTTPGPRRLHATRPSATPASLLLHLGVSLRGLLILTC